ncbi:MAG: tail fiber domain-containing protein [Acidobacteria bacterium]|nr:tail fiber domain-containing protein [Acidobacteriota bacterium]
MNRKIDFKWLKIIIGGAIFVFSTAFPAAAQYILNQTAPQTADFNITGSGTAGRFDAAAQYNLGGFRILAGNSVNLFAGWSAGTNNTTGNANTFVGPSTGTGNTTGVNNSFFGFGAGFANTTASDNAFFGAYSGMHTSTGYGNSFFGSGAGYSNVSGVYNLFAGAGAGTAVTSANYNTFVGSGTGYFTTTGSNNAFVGYSAGSANLTGFNNVFFGRGAGSTNTNGYDNTIIGANANVANNTLSYATAIGADAVVSSNNTIQLGRSNGFDKVVIYGLGAAGSTALCRNASNQIATCSSSLRYKTNIAPFLPGLSFIDRLRPISFDWKDGGLKDVGFGAEDVAKIDARFVTYNDEGQVEGVKYDRLSVAFVNAFKEQQTEIEAQEKLIARQQKQIDALTKLVCGLSPKAEICRGL